MKSEIDLQKFQAELSDAMSKVDSLFYKRNKVEHIGVYIYAQWHTEKD